MVFLFITVSVFSQFTYYNMNNVDYAGSLSLVNSKVFPKPQRLIGRHWSLYL